MLGVNNSLAKQLLSVDMDQVEIGIIGAGWWATANHIPALLKNPYVSAISVNRPDQDNLDIVCRQFHTKNGFVSTAEMLEQRPLKGVIISSPHIFHAEHAQQCIDRHLPVLIEKPMTANAADARALVNQAMSKGVEIVIPYGWNFKPFSEAAYDFMQRKYIGDVRHVVCQMASPTEDLFSGLGLEGTETDLFQPMASTWSDPSKAGGYGWGQLSHLLGLLFLLVPYSPTKVFAAMKTSSAGVDLYDAAVVTLCNGTTVSLSGSSTVPKSRSFQIDIRIFGTEGMLLLDIERERLEVIRNDGQTYVYGIPKGDGIYTCEEPVTRFVDICRGKRVFNPADGTIGMFAVQVLDAMYRSASTGMAEEI